MKTLFYIYVIPTLIFMWVAIADYRRGVLRFETRGDYIHTIVVFLTSPLWALTIVGTIFYEWLDEKL